MNLMADVMNQIGGRVSVATSAGKFTRLTLTLPLQPRRAGTATDAFAMATDVSKSFAPSSNPHSR